MVNTYLKNAVITVLSNKAQKVNTPGVHQLVIGSACDATRCFGYAWDYTFTVDLHTHFLISLNTMLMLYTGVALNRCHV